MGFEPKTLCFSGMGLLSSKSCWATASQYELMNSLLPKIFHSWKMKLLIFTYLTEVSWSSVNIYTVLGKCKALWAKLRLGLNSKAKNPPAIIAWATLAIWAGTETEFRKIFPDNFWLKLWDYLLPKLFNTYFQLGKKIWGVPASYNSPVSSITFQKDVIKIEAGLKIIVFF